MWAVMECILGVQFGKIRRVPRIIVKSDWLLKRRGAAVS